MNKDYGRLPSELYIEVTNRCNSRCQTCVRTFEQLEPLRDLDLDQFCALVDQVERLNRVVLHGVGEPLLNSDLAAMVAYLTQRADEPRVLFNSNALLLTPQRQDALLVAGLDEFRVSTDAAHRHLYAEIRGVDGFDQMVANVAAFAERIARRGKGPKLSLWFTAMRENLAELPDLVRLSDRLGVGEVYVQRLVFYGHGLAVEEQSLYQKLHRAEEDLLRQAGELAGMLGIAFRASGATSPRDSLSLRGAEEQPWSRCSRPWSLMYITAIGNVLPCCFSPFTTHDYPGLVLGNAFDTPVEEIWRGPSYERFRRALLSHAPPEACTRCGVYWSL